jgi:hypothetical protein
MTEEQPKSDTPQLTEIAATILTGLLASGEYTEGRTYEEADSSYPRTSVRVRPEAVATAIRLAEQLIEQTSAQSASRASVAAS